MSREARELVGLPAASGIAIGPAYVLRRERLVIPEFLLEPDEVEPEVARLAAAFEQTRARLEEIRSGLEPSGLVREVFEAQFLFLQDRALLSGTERSIREEFRNAEWALQRQFARIEEMFQAVSDPYIRERSSDVRLVVRRVLEALMGREPEGLANAPVGVVVVAEELSPADVAQITEGRVAGLVTEAGSRTSHVAIIARSLEIPAVVGAGVGLARSVADGLTVVLDGRSGRVLIDPEPDSIAEYEKRRADQAALLEQLLRYVHLPAETRDGFELRLLANVDLMEEIPSALRYGAQGIGLYRTEFMFMNRSDLPDEEEQFSEYRKLAEAIAPHGAVVRTLDLGGDKVTSGLSLPEEPNPALGLRGVRFSIAHPEIFRTQLRALCRASACGRLKLLLPMISGLAELDFALAELERVRAELSAEGTAFDPKLEVGVMIETPAAAMIADLIAPSVDFLSIGTNDLLQYTLAVDRANEHVAYLYEPLHPANLRLVQRVSQAARRAGISIGMCGEMAGDPLFIWVLMALGLDELSMTSSSIPMLKKMLRDSTLKEARGLLWELFELRGAREIHRRVEARMMRRFPREFEGLLPAG
ncbi:MAG: phosphoenolpyruvate--protein phosphotransferase [Myxococcales bacterium]|nr:phosphoenolpyruvate--protein phosphotransferase [Myxococcales bacterium]